MAITRRQFVTTLSALAAAMGVGQADISKITEAFAHSAPWAGKWASKPKVIWVHGAECTGCSTSLLSLFEDVRGKAVESDAIPYNTLQALDFAVGGTGNGNAVLNGTATADTTGAEAGHPYGHRSVQNTAAVTGLAFDSAKNANTPYIANIADVLIDFIDLQYHETVMGPGGDLAAQWLYDNYHNGSASPFVLVVEGAIQNKNSNGYWGALAAGSTPWCSIGMSDSGSFESSMDDVVHGLATQANCAAIVAIGQCATFGGYPACKSPVLAKDANGIANGASQTGALGTFDFLMSIGDTAAAAKVINAPGCPCNPWWFILTVVAWLVDFVVPSRPLSVLTPGGAINPAAVDSTRRLKAVYGIPLHGSLCPRYPYFAGVDPTTGTAYPGGPKFASHPGETGCLLTLGCKGPATKSLCHVHGWNAQQPRNDASWENSVSSVSQSGLVSGAPKKGSACIMAGHPCMGCTEKGYPDAFVPFTVR